MGVQAPEVVFDLLQVVGLALLTVVIYLHVLTSVFPETTPRNEESDTGGNWEVAAGLTQSTEKPDFAWGLISALFFSMSILALLGRLLFPWSILVTEAMVAIALGVLSFIVSLILALYYTRFIVPIG
ncbi:MAG: hypothetical protein ABEJ58_05830 [Halodesulfurarchaeum sp.]